MLKGYIAVTDAEWYRFLCDQPGLEEVNFWQPSKGRPIRTIERFDPFFFKLRSPYNAIVGFGLYVGHVQLPAWRAWDLFGTSNGAADFPAMRRRIEKLRSADIDDLGNYVIGCLMISQPVFFRQEDWITQPADWHQNVQQGNTYDLTYGEGRRVWEACKARLVGVLGKQEAAAPTGDRYGTGYFIKPRLGQASFHVCVEEAYEHACAVTGERSLPALEAAHVLPYASGGEHAIRNGILLRADIHRLFDKGYVTVTPDYRFEVSRRLKEDYRNGRTYYPLHGGSLRLPRHVNHRPDRGLLAWHNSARFLG